MWRRANRKAQNTQKVENAKESFKKHGRRQPNQNMGNAQNVEDGQKHTRSVVSSLRLIIIHSPVVGNSSDQPPSACTRLAPQSTPS